jgi:hypothetical protein
MRCFAQDTETGGDDSSDESFDDTEFRAALGEFLQIILILSIHKTVLT